MVLLLKCNATSLFCKKTKNCISWIIVTGLPTPKTADTDSRLLVETDELEDEVKAKPSQVADVEKPLPRKQRQPVKITIPALPVHVLFIFQDFNQNE